MKRIAHLHTYKQ